ncbi:efflux transporter outer membrane subunit [Kushneria indalinina]|uniref:Multidrug efflux system outer membrane protein n=1 Tax=Kushneria indalinina DSM 14324 TaxID=1122140 RepID=A0A3D9DV27_9GAMM|nr:efflux transporter outer membrane subunit [Kushneria indalinina]REC94602.1 multidrug efflux system outer membrane protein [Kushneria indalinina DSM 14324]
MHQLSALSPRCPAALLLCLMLVCTLLSACGAPAMAPAELTLREHAPLAGLEPDQDTPGHWPDARWWHDFNDPQLNALIERAMAGAPSLDSARARFDTASRQLEGRQADTRAQLEGSARVNQSVSHTDLEYPALGLPGFETGSAGDSQRSNAGLATLSFGWDVDWWGKKRAAIEAAVDQRHAARLEQAAAASAMQVGITRAYMDWQLRQAQLSSLDALLTSTRDSLRITALRVEREIENPARLDQVHEQLSLLEQQRAQLNGAARLDQVQLAALMGVSPDQLDDLTPRPLPQLETALPRDAGLELIARRPDIMASRWQVEAGMRGIDQARADYYPNVSLSALAGFLRVHPLGSGRNEDVAVASFGPAVTLPIFEGGRLDARYNASRAQLESAIADYNQRVVDAAQDVARQTVTMDQIEAQRAAQTQALQSFQHRLELARQRDARGVEDPRALIEAQQGLVREQMNRLALDGELLDTRIQLIHALGGGYHGRVPERDARYLTSGSTTDGH